MVRNERVDPQRWVETARVEREAGAVLLALWADETGSGFRVNAALLREAAVRVLQLDVPAASFPSLSPVFPAADRMERAAFDLLGVRAEGGDPRPWIRHAAWPADVFPLRRDFDAQSTFPAEPDRYPFVRVLGDGVHEIPVGPVHAGIIEPGHFRFSIIGEKVLRLSERLGYVHKGIEKRFQGMAAVEGRRLAARVSGDSAAAYSWAYCMALETIAGAALPRRALALRALVLERERIANHLGDLGALGNDAGFAFGLAQFSRLKEDVLRLNAEVYAARYPFDEIVPGGVAHDLAAPGIQRLLDQGRSLERELATLRGIYDDHAGMQDRFAACGVVAPDLAFRLGLVGLAGRASGQTHDLRCDLPVAPYDALGVKQAGSAEGDVAARVAVRFDELLESLRLCRVLLGDLPPGEVRAPVAVAQGAGLGLVEGWRGPVLVALDVAADGAVRRCHPHDPSWQNWPVLEHAVIGNIVPDFPLINKSFNLSYSGQDL